MKKISKQIFALALLVGLILSSLSPTVALAANDGSITVDNPKDGETYTLYRVFDLIMAPDVDGQEAMDTTTYLYKAVNETIEQTIKDHETYKALDSGKTSGGRMVIKAEPLTSGAINPYDFSNWLSGLDAGNFTKQGESITANGEGNNVKWNNLPLGYYMVKSSLGTLVSLNTTDKNVTIHEKNPDAEKIQLSKQVSGGVDGTGTAHNGFVKTEGTDGKNVYASIGEELTYQIIFNVHAYANKEYVLKDLLPTGIELVDEPSVKLGEDAMTTETTGTDESKKYTYAKDGQNLTFTFSEKTIQAIAASLRTEETNVQNNTSTAVTDVKTITITYKAKLNNNAEMSNHSGLKSNKNTVTLTYDQTAQPVLTLDASADVRTTDFNIFKFEKNTVPNTETALQNAKFKIHTHATDDTALKFTKADQSEDYFHDLNGTITEITTTDNGTFSIKGLKPGTYWIEEVEAPTGYNKIQDRMQLVIAENTTNTPATSIKYAVTVEGNDSELTDNIVKIENQTGQELPETGGRGRQLIYTLGGVLFAGSLVLLIAKKRSEKEEIK